MRVSSLGEALRVVMDGRGWSGSRLAREAGVSQPWVSMVLGGRRDPGMRRSAELLERAGWELHVVPREEDPVKRQEFLRSAAVAGAGLVFLPSVGADPYTSPEHLDRVTARLIYHESQMGGGAVAREALRHVRRTVAATEGAGMALHAAASRLCREAALILHDVRDLRQAEALARTALWFARTADDPTRQVQALDTLSLTAAHLLDGRGAEYARRGLAVAGAEPAHRAVLAARLGRTLAITRGGRSEAHRSLEHALELSGGELGAEIVGNVGIGFSELGMAALAEQHLTAAAKLTASSPFVHGLYVARLAKTAIRARQPEVAAERMTELATIAPLVDSPRLRIHERHIIDGTRHWAGVALVRDARDALRKGVA